MGAGGTDLLTPDPFLAQHLGYPAFRLDQHNQIPVALAGLPRYGPSIVQAKAPVAAVDSVGQLTAAGFQVVDVNVQLDVNAEDLRGHAESFLAGVVIRDAREPDRPAVERIAAENLIKSRFHLDPRIPSKTASRMKASWAGNFFNGRRGDRLLVADSNGRVGGFLLVLENGDEGVVDLVALDPDFRGKGIVGALLATWLDRADHLRRIIVGTQIANIPSLRSYSRLGFRPFAAAFVLHYHSGLVSSGEQEKF